MDAAPLPKATVLNRSRCMLERVKDSKHKHFGRVTASGGGLLDFVRALGFSRGTFWAQKIAASSVGAAPVNLIFTILNLNQHSIVRNAHCGSNPRDAHHIDEQRPYWLC